MSELLNIIKVRRLAFFEFTNCLSEESTRPLKDLSKMLLEHQSIDMISELDHECHQEPDRGIDYLKPLHIDYSVPSSTEKETSEFGFPVQETDNIQLQVSKSKELTGQLKKNLERLYQRHVQLDHT